MITMDVFAGDAFNTLSLTGTINKRNYFPSLIRSMGLFKERGVDTVSIEIEEKDGKLTLVQSSPRGAPPSQGEHERRRLRKFSAVRLSREAHMYADEVQGVRAFGTTTELERVEQKLDERVGQRQDEIDGTIENHCLGAIQGIVPDADGSILYDWFNEFGVTPQPAVPFDFSVPASDGRFRQFCTDIKRKMTRALAGHRLSMEFGVVGIAGDEFWDSLIKHQEIRDSYLATQEAKALREKVEPFESFMFGGVQFVNYPVSHDAEGNKDGVISIADDECRFFPRGVADLFEIYYAPADTFEWVNTPGLPSYVIPGEINSRSATFEVQSNPLVMCRRPRCLIQGTAV